MAERLKIALVSERFGKKFGGAESYAVHLVEILSRDHDVTIIAREFDHSLAVQEVQVQRLNGWPSWVRAVHFALQANKLTRTGYDVVHSHAMGPAGDVHVIHVVPVRFRRLFNRPWWRIVLSFLQPRNIAYLSLEAASVRSVPGHFVATVSTSTQEQLGLSYPALREIHVIPPGANPTKIQPEVREGIRALCGWNLEDIGCVLVARDPLRKGLATALEALSKLPDHYKLAVVGADAASRQYFSDRYPGLIERVTLLEPVSEVSQFYQAADICIHPTLLDSFGMVPLEAMAHGLPVILSSSKYCGFADYVQHHHDAWVIENPRDAAELAAALLSLGENQSLRDQLVSHSTSIVQRFAWQTVAERYLAIYAEVVQLKRSFQSQPRTQ